MEFRRRDLFQSKICLSETPQYMMFPYLTLGGDIHAGNSHYLLLFGTCNSHHEWWPLGLILKGRILVRSRGPGYSLVSAVSSCGPDLYHVCRLWSCLSLRTISHVTNTLGHCTGGQVSTAFVLFWFFFFFSAFVSTSTDSEVLTGTHKHNHKKSISISCLKIYSQHIIWNLLCRWSFSRNIRLTLKK